LPLIIKIPGHTGKEYSREDSTMPICKNRLMLLAAICCLFSCNWRKQNNPKALGLGLLTVNTQYPIPLYKNVTDDLPFDTLKFEIGKTGTTRFISNIKLKPYLINAGDTDKQGENNIRRGLVRFQPDLKFCVVETRASYFRVVTNETTMETLVIKKQPGNVYYTEEKMLNENGCSNCPGSKYNPRWYVYETWERYLKRVAYITKEDLVIYDAPGGKATIKIKNGDFQPFVATEVNGEWMKIKKGTAFESALDTANSFEGWTKWREGPKKLINVIEKTYD
jgi:hypothetical protein